MNNDEKATFEVTTNTLDSKNQVVFHALRHFAFRLTCPPPY